MLSLIQCCIKEQRIDFLDYRGLLCGVNPLCLMTRERHELLLVFEDANLKITYM